MTNLKPLGLFLALAGALSGCATFSGAAHGSAGDAKTTANVQTRLDQDRALGPPHSIDVQTVDNVVYLSGYVGQGLESRTAASIASETPGVRQVVNEIAVVR